MSLEIFRVPARLWACLCLSGLLVACEMPPREAMRIIRSQGLIPYLTGTYHPGMLGSGLLHQSRPSYLYSRPGFVRVPYRPVMAATPPSSRYMVDGETQMPYRPKPRPAPRRGDSDSSTVTTVPRTEARPPREAPPPSTKPAGGTETDPVASLPFGNPVPGRPGMVNSPYAQKRQLVDVTGMSPGETVKDPYTGKLFRVPPLPEASTPPPPASKSAPVPAPAKEAAAPAPAPAAPKEEPPPAPKTTPAPAPTPPVPKDKPATVEPAGGQTT